MKAAANRCPGHMPFIEYGIGDTKAYVANISSRSPRFIFMISFAPFASFAVEIHHNLRNAPTAASRIISR
jgi:hypothetical protein